MIFNWSLIGFVSLLFAVFLQSCKQVEFSEYDFVQVNYYTDPSSDQKFTYYLDDGEKIGDAIDHPMVEVLSNKGTFSDRKLMLLNYSRNLEGLSNTVTPFTYFFSTNIQDSLPENVKMRIYTDYLYDNPAQENYDDYAFFLENIERMFLMKIDKGEYGKFYYDAPFEYELIPFTVNDEEQYVEFETNSLSHLYGLVYQEEVVRDSVSFLITSGLESFASNYEIEGIYNNDNFQGAKVVGNNFSIIYSAENLNEVTIGKASEWVLEEFYIEVPDVTNAIIDPEKVVNRILMKIDDPELGSHRTHLRFNKNTELKFNRVPDQGKTGQLQITGKMQLDLTQKEYSVNILINYVLIRS